MEFGKTLRAAREAKGYTVSQLAETTHILSSVIEGLENENFKKIAAPIYGRGFVKLCCEALALDPQPMIAAFMALYTGEQEPATKAPAEPMPTPAAPTPPPVSEPLKPRAPVGADEIPIPNPQRDLFEQPVRNEPPPTSSSLPTKPVSRFAPPTPPDEPHRGIHLITIPWRLIFVLGAIILLIVLLVRGCDSLSQSFDNPKTESPAAAPAETSTAKPVDPATPKRTPKSVKPLYID